MPGHVFDRIALFAAAGRAGAAPPNVTSPGDPVEREAERLASTALSRTDAHSDDQPDRVLDRRTAPPGSRESTGRTLEGGVLRDMERRFSHDFSSVRVHTGARADNAAGRLGARAFTLGHEIVMRRDAFAPHTLAGRRLLAHELAHIVQPTPPGLILRQVADDDEHDPRARLPTALRGRWTRADAEIKRILLELQTAELTSATVTRRSWISELSRLWTVLAQVTDEATLESVERELGQLEKTVYDTAHAAGARWLDEKSRLHAEIGRMLEEPSLAHVHAIDYLTGIYTETRNRLDRTGLDVIVDEDFVQLRGTLDDGTHLWFGELQVARMRATELGKMLDVVGGLKGAGEDADKLVPGWEERIEEQLAHLDRLARGAQKQHYRVEFEKLQQRLRRGHKEAAARRPRKKGLAEKGFDLIAGAVGAVIDPLIEAGKQVVDLGQIAVHFVSFTHYKPRFVSDLARAAEKGATTTDLLEGMVKGLIETPERLYKAIKKDDWEAIGRETANLYMLAKSGKQGAAKAAPWIALVRARAAGLRGGISAQAALAIRKIAMKNGLVIRVRMAGQRAIKLRAKGHPAKPEFLKMKSISELDLHLGAQRADLGKVGFFEPRLPANLNRLSATLRAQVEARYRTRLAEWTGSRAEIIALEKKGLVKRSGQTLVDPKSGKAFTSDYDLFDIRVGNEKGPAIEYESLPKDVRVQLEAKPAEIQHGAHLDWKEIPAGQAANYAEIILNARPRPGAEPLIEFHRDGRIRYTYFVD